MLPKSNTEPFVILLAEDEKTDAFFVQEAINRMECITQLHSVKDGQSVLDFLRREGEFSQAPRPDIVLLDINMPRKNGHEVLSDIKSDPALQAIPVIVLSGSSAEKDIQRSYAAHANAYVMKAYDFSGMMKLMAAIEVFWFRSTTLVRK